MRLVIADTGPINYLLLIGHIDILPALFEKTILPVAVREELSDSEAPGVVQNWIAKPPPWLEIRRTNELPNSPTLSRLDPGERAAIALALELDAELLLIDDRDGVAVARQQGLRVAGTLGVLAMAAQNGLLDLAAAFDRLKSTNFHCRQELFNQLLDEVSREK